MAAVDFCYLVTRWWTNKDALALTFLLQRIHSIGSFKNFLKNRVWPLVGCPFSDGWLHSHVYTGLDSSNQTLWDRNRGEGRSRARDRGRGKDRGRGSIMKRHQVGKWMYLGRWKRDRRVGMIKIHHTDKWNSERIYTSVIKKIEEHQNKRIFTEFVLMVKLKIHLHFQKYYVYQRSPLLSQLWH